MIFRFVSYFLILYLGVGCGANALIEPEITGSQHNKGDFILDLPNDVKMAFMKMGSKDLMMGKTEIIESVMPS